MKNVALLEVFRHTAKTKFNEKHLADMFDKVRNSLNEDTAAQVNFTKNRAYKIHLLFRFVPVSFLIYPLVWIG